MNLSFNGTEKTLDPADWQAMRALGHRMVDDMIEYLETLRDRPVWQRVLDRVHERFDSQVPEAEYWWFSGSLLSAYPAVSGYTALSGWAVVFRHGSVAGDLLDEKRGMGIGNGDAEPDERKQRIG